MLPSPAGRCADLGWPTMCGPMAEKARDPFRLVRRSIVRSLFRSRPDAAAATSNTNGAQASQAAAVGAPTSLGSANSEAVQEPGAGPAATPRGGAGSGTATRTGLVNAQL
eukprot:7377601-Prymnesium_polylepis.2